MPTAAWLDLAQEEGEPDWMPLARQFGNCKRTFILHVPSWKSYVAKPVLTWKSVPYDSDEDPDDERGVYAFVLDAGEHSPSPIPPFSCVLYVGETGEASNATLKSRLENYRNKKAQRERPRIYGLLEQWGDSLFFYYATIAPGASTKECETALLDALLPPANSKDFSAKVSNARNHVLSS